MILGSISLGGSPNNPNPDTKENKQKKAKEKSDETRLSILKFLNELLRPRFQEASLKFADLEGSTSRGVTTEKKQEELSKDWEWDGVSELPSLDEFDSQQEVKPSLSDKNDEKLKSQPNSNAPEPTRQLQLYPSSNHLLFSRSPTPRGALSHLLTTCLNLSCGISKSQLKAGVIFQSQVDGEGMQELRELALVLSGRVLRTWIGGVREVEVDASWDWSLDFKLNENQSIQESSLHALVTSNNLGASHLSTSTTTEASSLRVFFPGFISSMTRLLSTLPSGSGAGVGHESNFSNPQNSKNFKPATAKMCSIALDQMRELIHRCLGDELTKEERVKIQNELHLGIQINSVQSKISSLEDFAGIKLSDEEGDEASTSNPAQSTPTSDSSSQMHKKEKGVPVVNSFLQSSFPPLHSSLVSLSPLISHSSPRVQSAMLLLAFELLSKCEDTLRIGDVVRSRSRASNRGPGASRNEGEGEEVAEQHFSVEAEVEELGREKSSINLLLGWMLDLSSSSNSFSDNLSELGKFCSRHLLVSSPNYKSKQSLLLQVLGLAQSSLTRLPKAIKSRKGDAVIREAGRIKAMLYLIGGDSDPRHSVSAELEEAREQLAALLGPKGTVQDWDSSLLDCLSLSLSPMARSNTTTGDTEESKDQTGDGWSRSFENLEEDPKSGREVRGMFQEIGKAIGNLLLQKVKKSESQKEEKNTKKKAKKEEEEDLEKLLHSVYHFLAISSSYRSVRLKNDASNSKLSLTAALFADEIIKGIAFILADERLNLMPGREGKRLRKISQKLGKEIQDWVSRIWEEDGAEGVENDDRREGNNSASGAGDQLTKRVQDQVANDTQIQHLRGMDAFPNQGSNQTNVEESSLRLGGAIDLSFVKHAKMSSSFETKPLSITPIRTHLSSLNLSTLLQLSILASSSKLLGLKFRPFLQSLLYPLVASLAANSSNSLIPDATFRILSTIANESGYGDLRNMIMSNSDWILGESSWRLVNGLGQALESSLRIAAYSSGSNISNDIQPRVSQVSVTSLRSSKQQQDFLPLVSALTAPLVLVQTLRLLGSEALPLVEDAVDEVLDALDRFHGEEAICAGLWNVLDGMVDCMLEDKQKEGLIDQGGNENPSEANPTKAKLKTKTPLEHLERWFKSRSGVQKGQGKGKAVDGADSELPPAFDLPPNSDEDDDGNRGDTPAPPATRSQEVLISIISKSIPFLSHASPFMRTKVLRLISNGVEIFSTYPNFNSNTTLSPSVQRSEDLLPILNRAWPLILSRLGINSSIQFSDLKPALSERERQKEKRKLQSQSSEMEPVVWLESIKLLNTISKYVNEFLGKKIAQEALPRMTLILDRIGENLLLQRKASLNSKLINQTSPTFSTSTASPSSLNFYRIPSNSLQSEIFISIFKCISSNLTSQGPLFSEETAFQILTNPSFLVALDVRQDPKVRAEALELFRNLGKLNPDAVWLALHCVGSKERGQVGIAASGWSKISWLKGRMGGDGLVLEKSEGGERNEIRGILNGLYSE